MGLTLVGDDLVDNSRLPVDDSRDATVRVQGRAHHQVIERIQRDNDEILAFLRDTDAIKKSLRHDLALIDDAIEFRKQPREDFDTSQQYFRARKGVDQLAGNAKKRINDLADKVIERDVKHSVKSDSAQYSFQDLQFLPQEKRDEIRAIVTDGMRQKALEHDDND